MQCSSNENVSNTLSSVKRYEYKCDLEIRNSNGLDEVISMSNWVPCCIHEWASSSRHVVFWLYNGLSCYLHYLEMFLP